VRFRGFPVLDKRIAYWGRRALKKSFPNYRAVQLNSVIKRIKPHIVHSLEIQGAGYLALKAKKRFHGQFPPLIVTNWGSDIYVFGRLSEHAARIRELLAQCEFYSCECERDVAIARSFGFEGEVLPVFPNTGGFDLNRIGSLKQGGRTSQRRLIMLKGYQGWAGRSLAGLRALERCAEILKDYEICVYSASEDVELAAALFAESTGIPVRIIPEGTPHVEMLKMFGKARVAIGLSIGDAISTTFLESLSMGSFPIQSWTSCANEWIEDGVTGILVPPEDPEVIEKAIRRAVLDDGLVDNAAEENWLTTKKRLDDDILKRETTRMYEYVYEKTS
jgi:glycosyltransferase involved in cell wall biosynthesis